MARWQGRSPIVPFFQPMGPPVPCVQAENGELSERLIASTNREEALGGKLFVLQVCGELEPGVTHQSSSGKSTYGYSWEIWPAEETTVDRKVAPLFALGRAPASMNAALHRCKVLGQP